MDQLSTLFSSPSKMIPGHARPTVAHAPARSARRSCIVKSLFRHQRRYVQCARQATMAHTRLTSWKLIRSERNPYNWQWAWPSRDCRPMLFPGGRRWDMKIRGIFLDLFTDSMRKRLGNEFLPPHHPLPPQILYKPHVKQEATKAHNVTPPVQERWRSVQPENTHPKCCQRTTGYQLPPKQYE
jgi:hypothetical protein